MTTLQTETITKVEQPLKAIWGLQWVNNAADRSWQALNNKEGKKLLKPLHYLGYRAISLIIIPCNVISLIVSLFGKILLCPCTEKRSYFANRLADSWKILKNQFALPCEVYFLICKTPPGVNILNKTSPKEITLDEEFASYKNRVNGTKVHEKVNKQINRWKELAGLSQKVDLKETKPEEVKIAKNQFVELAKELILDEEFESSYLKVNGIFNRELESQHSSWKELVSLFDKIEDKNTPAEEAKTAKMQYNEKAKLFVEAVLKKS